MKKIVVLAFVLVVLSTAVFVGFVRPVIAQGIIYIKADGSIDPPSANITSTDNITYTFIANIYDERIVVERSNIILDGNGYTLQGRGAGSGIYVDGSTFPGVNNVTIQNVNVKLWDWGVHLERTYNNTVSGNNIAVAPWGYGICLIESSSNSISGNNITNSYCGILLYSSCNNNTISGNTVTNNEFGFWLAYTTHNNVTSNNITNNTYGIVLESSSNNTLSLNLMNNNRYSFEVRGYNPSHFLHSIDVSNLIDEKPVYYLVNQSNLAITPATHPKIGYLALINCTNITVQNLYLTNNWQGLLLACTQNSYVKNNTLANNIIGIELYASPNNTISGNNITNNDFPGIWLLESSDNSISGNNITANNLCGIFLDVSSNNGVSGNSIKTNNYGIAFSDSSNNRIYHNNFANNTIHAYDFYWGDYNSAYNISVNVWDNGFEGNYWSNYTGVDLDHDGIGDTSHLIDGNNTDHCPLMGMFHSFNTSLGYYVNVISNSTIENFQYFESNSTIRMYVSNMTANQTFGFCRVTIPKSLMPPPYEVKIDDGLTEVLYFNDTVYDNSTHIWIYFAYEHSTHKVDIIPEFPTWTSILLIVLTVAITIYKRRLLKTPVH